MSHMATVGPVIRSLQALEKACLRLGLVLRLDRKSANYYNHQKKKCFAVIEVSGSAYEIAVTQNADGSYSMSADMDGDIEAQEIKKKAGNNLSELSKHYSAEYTKIEARKKGYSVYEKAGANGSLKLTLKKKRKQRVSSY